MEPIQKKPDGLPIVQLGSAPPRQDASPPRPGDERVDLPITGMSCAACARRIETARAKAPGVHRAGVNLATSRATVEYDPARAGVRDFMRVVEDVGYGTAGTARADFVVDDSARPSGSPKPLEDHLLARRGVVSAEFNLATMEVRVEYLPGAADAAECGSVRRVREVVDPHPHRGEVEVRGNHPTPGQQVILQRLRGA